VCLPVVQVASQLECETRALEARIAALSEEAEVLAGAVRDAKAEGHDLAAAAAATKQQLAAARVEADGLRAQIVSAPEAVVTALAEVNGAVERARLRCAYAEAKTREQLARADQLARLDKELRKATAVAAEGCAAVAARKEASHVLKARRTPPRQYCLTHSPRPRSQAARARLSENEAEGWRLVSEKEHLQRTLATVAERQARLEQQGELKVRAPLPCTPRALTLDTASPQREAAAAALRAAEGEAAAANARSDSSASRVAENTAAARQLEVRLRDALVAQPVLTWRISSERLRRRSCGALTPATWHPSPPATTPCWTPSTITTAGWPRRWMGPSLATLPKRCRSRGLRRPLRWWNSDSAQPGSSLCHRDTTLASSAVIVRVLEDIANWWLVVHHLRRSPRHCTSSEESRSLAKRVEEHAAPGCQQPESRAARGTARRGEQ
jgi:hypothetical protein